MGDTTEEISPSSGNISNEEQLLTSEKMEQPSEDKFVAKKDRFKNEAKKMQEDKEEGKKSQESNEVKQVESKQEQKMEIKEIKAEEKLEEKESKIEKPLEALVEDLAEKSVKKISDSVPCCTKEPREKIIRNQSDIFSLKDISTNLQTSIFSVNGSPSRRVFRKQEPAGHVFQKNDDPPSEKTTPRGNRITRENYNDEKRPSNSHRNPLTGTGLSSNDEYKSKGIKRKDGNPLLGLGYDSEVNSVSSQHRIPPGGYSHKLW